MNLTSEQIKRLIKEELSKLLPENDDASSLASHAMEKVEKYDGVNMSRSEANAAWEQVQEMASQGWQSGIDLDDIRELRKKVNEWNIFEKSGKPVREYLKYYNADKEDAIYDIAEEILKFTMFSVADFIKRNYGTKNAQDFDEKFKEGDETFSVGYTNLISALENVVLKHNNISQSDFFDMHFINMLDKYFMSEIKQNISIEPYSIIKEYVEMPYFFMKDLVSGEIKNTKGDVLNVEKLRGINNKQTLENIMPWFEMWRALKGI